MPEEPTASTWTSGCVPLSTMSLHSCISMVINGQGPCRMLAVVYMCVTLVYHTLRCLSWMLRHVVSLQMVSDGSEIDDVQAGWQRIPEGWLVCRL
jgi:hypothetical protein